MKKIALIFSGFVLMLGIIEILHQKLLFTVPISIFDRRPVSWGWTYTPNSFFFDSGEGLATGYMNNEGFKDITHTLEKPAHVKRIAILGDSYVEALGVPIQKTFPVLLERYLNSRAGQGEPYEVLSVGLSGWGTAAYKVAYDQVLEKYKPDYVIVCMNWNDYLDNSAMTNAFSPTATWDGHHLRYSGGSYPDPGEGELKTRWITFRLLHDQPDKIKRSYIILSRLFSTTIGKFLSLGTKYVFAADIPVSHPPAQDLFECPGFGPHPLTIDRAIFREPSLVCDPDFYQKYKPFFSASLELMKMITLDLRRKVESHGGKLMVVRIPFPFEIYPQLKVVPSLDAHSWSREMDQLYRQESLPEIVYFDLTPDLHQASLATMINSGDGNGHWNLKGHEIVAQSLARFLEKSWEL